MAYIFLLPLLILEENKWCLVNNAQLHLLLHSNCASELSGKCMEPSAGYQPMWTESFISTNTARQLAQHNFTPTLDPVRITVRLPKSAWMRMHGSKSRPGFTYSTVQYDLFTYCFSNSCNSSRHSPENVVRGLGLQEYSFSAAYFSYSCDVLT